MSLLLIVWTRLSHGSVVIRSSLEILIPREDGIMSDAAGSIAAGQAANSSSSTSGHSSINTLIVDVSTCALSVWPFEVE